MSVPQSFSSPLLATLLHLLLLFGPSALARAQARCRSCRPRAALSWADCLSRAGPAGISLHVILKAMNSKGEKSLKRHKEASSHPDLELLLHPTEHGEEEEEDLETHSNTN